MESLVSVIIPIYNGELTLKRCLESVLTQTYRNLEVLLIDDGSTDQSFDLCRHYASADPRIRVIRQENAGPSHARNVGMDLARGEYILFVDSDDYLEVDLAEKCMHIFDTHGCDMVLFGFCYESRFSRRTPVFSYRSGLYRQAECRRLAVDLIDDNTKGRIPTYSVVRMTKASVFENPQIRFDERIRRSEDYLFWTQINFRIRTLYLLGEETLYHYVSTGNSITQKYLPDYWDMVKMIYAELTEKLPAGRRIKTKLQNMLIWHSCVAFHVAQQATTRDLFARDFDRIFRDADLRKAARDAGLFSGTLKSRLYCAFLLFRLKPVIKQAFPYLQA